MIDMTVTQRRRRFSWLACVVVALVVAGCNGAATPTVTAPTVAATVPDDAATGVAGDSDILITFSRAMNPVTTAAAFSSEPAIACTFSWNATDTVLTCSPEVDLEADTVYEVTIAASATAADAAPLADAYTFGFTTATGDVDPSAPTVAATSPEDAALNVSIGSHISVTFSQAMDTASTEGAFSVMPAVACSFGWSAADTVLTCTPEDDLLADTVYTVTIAASATAADAVPLADAYTFGFTTATGDVDPSAPTVAATSPEDAALNVSIGSHISVTFSQAMDTASTEGAFTVVPAVACSFGWSAADTVLTCTPEDDLLADTVYIVTIAASATDATSTPLDASVSFTFATTGSEISELCILGTSVFGGCRLGP